MFLYVPSLDRIIWSSLQILSKENQPSIPFQIINEKKKKKVFQVKHMIGVSLCLLFSMAVIDIVLTAKDSHAQPYIVVDSHQQSSTVTDNHWQPLAIINSN
jgi:hypothetical protein